MINKIIAGQRRRASQRILRRYQERSLPFALLAPSAGFGLYAAARDLLSPGDTVLISPITCRTVIAALSAAGVRPVFVDIDPADGNIDLDRLRPELLRSARAIVTTNLYGSPDRAPELRRISERHGLLLIEDCAHVLDSAIDGQRIGSIGDVAVFSFKKYFNEPGGVVAVRSKAHALRLADRIACETAPPPVAEDRVRYCQSLLLKAAGPRITRRASAWLRRSRQCPTAAPGIGPCDGAFDGAPSKRMPNTASLLRVAAIVGSWDRLVAAHRAQTLYLISRCGLPLKQNAPVHEFCRLAVPFYCPDRDRIVAALERRGIPTFFRYFPPMNQVFPEFAAGSSLDSARLEEWFGTILPIQPRFGRELLEVLEEFAPVKSQRLGFHRRETAPF